MKIFWTNIRVTDEGILYMKPDNVQGDLWAFDAVHDLIKGKRITPNEHIEALPACITRVSYNPDGDIRCMGFIGGSCELATIDCRDTGLFIHELDHLTSTCRGVFEELVELLVRETKSGILSVHQSQSKDGALTYHLELPPCLLARTKKRNRTHYACCF